MGNTLIRKEVCKFPVEVDGDLGPNRIEDIYITELGYVMVSVFNLEKKVYVNYICEDIKNILPQKIRIKGEEGHQSFPQRFSKDDKF